MLPSRRLLALALLPALAAPALADDDFIGFYQGINTETGSLSSLSIVESGNGFSIAAHATVFGDCEGSDKTATLTADGTMARDVLKRSNGQLRCVATGTTATVADGDYILSDDEEIVTLRVPGRPDLHYHRLSD
ncbi:MAG: hypothetical protein AAGB11_08485 [Pseudomonadota bacterium]